MKILFLSSWFPYPKDNGSKIRVYNLLRGLAKHHDITLLSFTDTPVNPSQIVHLENFCHLAKVVPSKKYNPFSIRSLLGIFSSIPRSLYQTYSHEMFSAIEKVIKSEYFDLVIASQLNTAIYWKAFQKLPAIFEEIEVGIFKSWLDESPSEFHKIRHKITLLKQRIFLNKLLSHFIVSTVVSENELHLVKELCGSNHTIEMVQNSIDLLDYEGVLENKVPYEIIFTGSFRYFANYKGVLWFLNNVYPRIRERKQEISLTITGDHMGLAIPTEENVTLTGNIPNIYNRIARACISIVPIIEGGGTRLKILEAMALNTPVVSTSKGAEGLEVENGKHLLLADTPEDFSNAIIQLIDDKALRATISNQANCLIKEKYDIDRIIKKYLQIIDRIVAAESK
jgi:polysaccharide biosynthesis protein PslH